MREKNSYNSRNPMLRPSQLEHSFEEAIRSKQVFMTAKRTYQKAFAALFLALFFATLVWRRYAPEVFGTGKVMNTVLQELIALSIATSFCSFILVFLAYFKPTWSYLITPLYACFKGVALSGLSLAVESSIHGFQGLTSQALLATTAVLLTCLLIHTNQWIKMTTQRMRMLSTISLAIIFFYVARFLFSLFGINTLMFDVTSLPSIACSIFMICLASFFLLADFYIIERCVAQGAPKYMEWYCALSLLSTIAWIYLEVFRLLLKLKKRSGRR